MSTQTIPLVNEWLKKKQDPKGTIKIENFLTKIMKGGRKLTGEKRINFTGQFDRASSSSESTLTSTHHYQQKIT